MAKFSGIVGYNEATVETSPGIWEEVEVTRQYYGELTRNNRSLQTADLNDNIKITNTISIVSDPYANENFHSMRYVEFMGTKWKIESVEVQYPRLILTIGGVYNGEQTISAGTT